MAGRSSFSLALALTVIAGLGVACGDDARRPAAVPTTTTPAAGPTGKLIVLAAASLTEAFTDLGREFEATHPGTKAVFSFDASSALAAQANSGAPADVFASADEANMAKVTEAGNAAEPTVFARNRLNILVTGGNPKKVTGLADLGRSAVTFVVCAPEVPCGRYAAEALRQAGVRAQPKSYETSVKGVVTKVRTGSVDAGIAYATDARAAAPALEGIDIPDEQNVLAEYRVAPLEQSSNPELAAAFLDYLLGPDGQAILAKHGFSRP